MGQGRPPLGKRERKKVINRYQHNHHPLLLIRAGLQLVLWWSCFSSRPSFCEKRNSSARQSQRLQYLTDFVLAQDYAVMTVLVCFIFNFLKNLLCFRFSWQNCMGSKVVTHRLRFDSLDPIGWVFSVSEFLTYPKIYPDIQENIWKVFLLRSNQYR